MSIGKSADKFERIASAWLHGTTYRLKNSCLPPPPTPHSHLLLLPRGDGDIGRIKVLSPDTSSCHCGLPPPPTPPLDQRVPLNAAIYPPMDHLFLHQIWTHTHTHTYTYPIVGGGGETVGGGRGEGGKGDCMASMPKHSRMYTLHKGPALSLSLSQTWPRCFVGQWMVTINKLPPPCPGGGCTRIADFSDTRLLLRHWHWWLQ